MVSVVINHPKLQGGRGAASHGGARSPKTDQNLRIKRAIQSQQKMLGLELVE